MTDVNDNSIAAPLGMKGFVHASALDGNEVEANGGAGAVGSGVDRGKLPEDPAADLVALCAHLDRFHYVNDAVALDLDLTVEGQNAFGSAGCAHRQQRETEQDSSHHCSSAGCACWAPSSSKYSAAWKPNSRATIRSGNVSTRVFRLLTAPL